MRLGEFLAIVATKFPFFLFRVNVIRKKIVVIKDLDRSKVDTDERTIPDLKITTPRTAMGSSYSMQKRNRCERQEMSQQPTERETHRRFLICVGQHGLCVRQYPEILMPWAEDRNRTRPPDLVVSRTVSFATDVTVFIPLDWSPETYRLARQGPWLQIAVDRHRFMRRIRQTENDLANIFTIEHRDRMRERFCD